MIKMARKGRLRSVVSATVAFAMIMSIMVMPAAANPWPAQKKAALSAFSGGSTNLTETVGTTNYKNPGLNGTMAVSIIDTATPSTVATFTPSDGGRPYNLEAQLGYYSAGSAPNVERFVTGLNADNQYTALRIYGFPGWFGPWGDQWNIQFSTVAPAVVTTGTLTFTLGTGERYRGTSGSFNQPTISPSGIAAGKSDTFTVSIPAQPTDPYGNATIADGMQDAVDAVRVLYPKGFVLAPATAAATATIVGPDTDQSAQSVVTSVTAFGPMVTVSNIYWPTSAGDLPVVAGLTAPTKAATYDDGVKVWIHQVGSPAGLWIPIFCPSSDPSGDGPLSIDVGGDVLASMTGTAEINRAGGYTQADFMLLDQYGNEVEPAGNISVAHSGIADGAYVWRTSDGHSDHRFIWNFADTPGVNTLTGTYTEAHALPIGNITKSFTLTKNTTPVGSPYQIRVLPSADASGNPQTTWADGSTPQFFLQLQDKDGNPTSYLDTTHGATTWNPTLNPGDPHEFRVNGMSVQNPDLYNQTLPIYRGWSRSSDSIVDGLPVLFNWGAAGGPDTWVLNAKAAGGLVEKAPFTTITINAPIKSGVGIPVGVKVTAVTKAPADFAEGDDLYNDKWWLEIWNVSDDAFGYAKGDGSEKIAFTAQIVDVNNDPVALQNVDMNFTIPQFAGQNGTLMASGASTATLENMGHDATVKTNASGAAVIEMKAYRPTVGTFENNSGGPWDGDYTWFTELQADAELPTTGTDWAHPCLDSRTGYGFGYFHGGQLSDIQTEQTKEGNNKWIALANGTDSVTYTASVTDRAFGTPVAGWDVNFTTNWGYLNTPGSTIVPATTNASGTASVKAYSPLSGTAYVSVSDRQLDRSWAIVDFTDWMVRTKVLDTSMPAGDRATALIQATFVNIKDAAKKIEWNDSETNNWSMNFSGFNPQGGNVFGYDTYDGTAVMTNSTSVAEWDVDTDANGKFDAVNLTVPAEDANGYTWFGYPLESAGKRYALLEGSGGGRMDVGNIFYNEYNFVAAAERPIPEVNFVKTAVLNAEGTMWSPTFSITGTGFTPGTGAPDYTDMVSVYLGDFTSEPTAWLHPQLPPIPVVGKYLGQAYVTKDGSLLPTALWDNALQASLSPGTYNISVDGLVFPGGLTIKNLYGEAAIEVLYAPTFQNWGFYFVESNKVYPLNVRAKGSQSTEVYFTADSGAMGPKLVATGDTTMFDLDMKRLRKAGYSESMMSGGAWIATARTTWPGIGTPLDGLITLPGYETVTTANIWVRSKLQFAKAAFSNSKRTLKVGGVFTGRTEANGNANIPLRVTVQIKSGSKWKTYSTKTIIATPTSLSGTNMAASYYTTMKVKKAGTYRVVVSHEDISHNKSSVTSRTRKIK